MANAVLTTDEITREALRVLHQKLNFVTNIVTEYDDSFAVEGAKIGNTLRVRQPIQYSTGTGATIATGTTIDTQENSVTLTVNSQRHVPMRFTSNEMTMKIDDFSARHVEPAMSVLAAKIEAEVRDVEVVDRVTAYQATPGYSAQQSTLDTQRDFALLIGILVIGGFFQILTLQKVAQIGMLKAIGAPNPIIGAAAIIQIIAVTVAGVAVGAALSLALSLGFPPQVPIIFSPPAVGTAVASLLLIGPVGGLVSVRYSLKVEPLTALGLAQ